jgi:hypothetical protein
VSRRWWLAADIAVKVALVGLLIFAVVRSDLPQFQGDAMTARAIVYPLSVAIVPVAWLMLRRRRPFAYPFDVDILIVLPFLVETAGNSANLYDSIDWWDDAIHFFNWLILVLAVGLLLARTSLSPLVVAGLAVGFGAVTAILWELLEYVTSIHDSTELQAAYHDSLGDLTLGLSGSIVAAGLAALAATRADRARDRALRA